MFVRVVGEIRLPKKRIPLNQILAPELNIHMLALLVRGQHLLSHRNRLAVEIVAQGDSRKLEQRGHNVCVARGNGLDGALWNAWTADKERDVHVFFNVAALSRGQAVLADMEPIVCGVDEVRVVQDSRIRAQTIHDGIDEFVYRLQRLQPFAVPVVVVIYFGLVELSDRFEVRSCPRLWCTSE